MGRVFICHAFNDKEIAKKIGIFLRNKGIDTFLDCENIFVGTNFIKEINLALENCDTFILLWSVFAENSDFVNDEWTAAKRLNKKIIPCRLDDTKLPAILSTLQYIDFTKLSQGLDDLINCLQFFIPESINHFAY